jgi:hypothetical protein
VRACAGEVESQPRVLFQRGLIHQARGRTCPRETKGHGRCGGCSGKNIKISETEAVQGLASEFEIVDNQLKNLRREYGTTSQEKDKILDDLKQQL